MLERPISLNAVSIFSGEKLFRLISTSFKIAGLVLCLTTALGTITAQDNSLQRATARNMSVPVISDDSRYRIGPGDVLEIKVLKAPELSRESVRVDQKGTIRMPMLQGEIVAACLTETELAQKLVGLYLEYKRNPVVDVFVKEFQSQPVSIVGALNNVRPEGTQFRLHRRVRLLELVALSGGLSERAGQTVNIVHTAGLGLCEPGEDAAKQGDLGVLTTYKLNDTMKGAPEANPVLRPGDIVVVPEGDQAYVVGNVLKPTTIPLREPTTVSRAIAMAGGTAPATKRDKVRIVRQVPGSQIKQEIFVNLTAIEKQQTQDVVLMPNDIVDVPSSATKNFLRTLMGAVAPAVSQGAVRVIP